jgi:predicted RNA-binding Zn ribbon-like protein
LGHYTEVAPLPGEWSRFAFLDLINSTWTDHVRGQAAFDRLQHPAWQREFLRRWDLGPAAGSRAFPVGEMGALRKRLRSLAENVVSGRQLPAGELRWLSRRLREAPEVKVVSEIKGHYSLTDRPLTRDWAWTQARVVLSFVEFMARNEPQRLKRCQNPNCSWVFYDESRALSRRWCDPAACGNLVKVRLFRQRRRRAAVTG